MGISINNDVQASRPVLMLTAQPANIANEAEPSDVYLEGRPKLELFSTISTTAVFAKCREILTDIADDRIPRDKDQLKACLQALKKAGELIDKGAQIPTDIARLYAQRYREIVANIKAFVAEKSERVARNINFSPDPDAGIRELCGKAKSALPWVDYIV